MDVPWPADYGGAIDIFFRIRALHQLGFEITLHSFEYGRGQQHQALDKYTKRCCFYKRKKRFFDWLSPIPFIVKTRSNKELIENLLQDDAPILFEGLHSTFFLGDERLKNRIKLVRTHNVEHDYYSGLATQTSGIKKLFFNTEARKLRNYEPILKQASHVLAIQENDCAHFKTINSHVHLLPASIPPFEQACFVETQAFCLFHGNLSVKENESAAAWILDALKQSDIDLTIAGKNPSEKLKVLCNSESVRLITNPTQEEMEVLIQSARVHVLYTHQSTGLKLKLLSALNSSGHVLVNDKMLDGTDLAVFCHTANSQANFCDAVRKLMIHGCTADVFDARQRFLKTHYSTVENCRLIARLLNAE